MPLESSETKEIAYTCSGYCFITFLSLEQAVSFVVNTVNTEYCFVVNTVNTEYCFVVNTEYCFVVNTVTALW